MRVGLDAKVLAGPPGGVRRYVEGLLAALGRTGTPGPAVEPLVPGTPGSTLAWVAGPLRRASRRFDVLHCPFYYGPPRPRCPVVVAIHDILPVEHPEWFPRAWANPLRWLIPWAARSAAAIVVYAHSVAERIEARFGIDRARIRVIPHGVDPTRFAPPSPERVGAVRRRWSGGRPYVLQVGALEPRRGVDLALAAVGELRRDYRDLVLLLTGPDRAPVPGLDPPPPWVIRTGAVPEEELPALYAGAEAVLSPSRGEGFDLPLLEALACGAPVVASDIDVHVEHFAQAVALFSSGDREGLAGALERVLGDGEYRAELVRRGRRLAAAFSWERSARAHAELWLEVAGGGGAAARRLA